MNVFEGRGIWIWEVSQTNIARTLRLAQLYGWDWVAVKSHDGVDRSDNTPAQISTVRAECRRRGLKFGLWGYLYGKHPGAGEAQKAVADIHAYRADFYIADAEAEYETHPDPVSEDFAAEFRRLAPNVPAALSSFGRVDLHGKLDWDAWRHHGFEFLPQAYNNETLLDDPASCVRAAQRWWKVENIHPTVATYKGALGAVPPPDEAKKLRALPTKGYSLWDAQEGNVQGYLKTLGRQPQPKKPTHVVPPAKHPGLAKLRAAHIRLVQKEINAAIKRLGIPLTPLVVDGVPGPHTEAYIHSLKFFLGYGRKYLHGPADSKFVHALVHPARELGRGAALRGWKRRKAARLRHRLAEAGVGLTLFDGHRIPSWIAPILKWCREHGWTGIVVSGFRTHQEQLAAAIGYVQRIGSTLAATYPSGVFASNHCKRWWPGGAVDVTNYQQLAAVLKGLPRRFVRRLVWAGPVIGDQVHFSSNGH